MSTSPATTLSHAALLGSAAGLRTFTPVVALARQGSWGDGRARRLTSLMAVGELVGDKLSMTPARTSPPALAARVLSGALCAGARGGRRAAPVGAVFAVATAYGGERARSWIVGRSGRPDALVAAGEDVLTMALAFAGARGVAR